MKKRTTNKKKIVEVLSAKLYIVARINNTILTLAKDDGNVLCQESCGSSGFKNCKKSTPHASHITFARIKQKIALYGVKQIDVIINGAGIARDMISMLHDQSFSIKSISDNTGYPHNGCRARTPRRN